jgi:hypothetical protein
MADVKASAFTEDGTPIAGDGFPYVKDFAGTPTNAITDIEDLQTAILAGAFTVAGTPTDGYVVQSDEGTPTWMPPPSPLGSTGDGFDSVKNTAASYYGVTVIADATPHTKGAWVDLITSSAVAAETLGVFLVTSVQSNGTNTSTLLDIGLWNGSSYDVLIPDLAVGLAPINTVYEFNLAVASGARLGARCQSTVASKSFDVGIFLREGGGPEAAPTTVTAYGVLTASSSVTALTVAGSTHTKAAWTDITMSTSAAASKMFVDICGLASGSTTAATGLVDIGLWNGSSYDVIIPDLPYQVTAGEIHYAPCSMRWFEVDLPSGSRLGARYQATSAAAAARPSVSLYLS